MTRPARGGAGAPRRAARSPGRAGPAAARARVQLVPPAPPLRAGEDLVPDRAGRVLRQFRIVFNAVRHHFQQVQQAAGASGAQVWALHLIHERPGLGVGELARAMDVRQPTASSFVASLARLGLIEVRRDAADRRAVQLRATARGRRALREVPGPHAGLLPAALAALDPATLARLEADLAVLVVRLDADRGAATIPLGAALDASQGGGD